MSKNMVVLSITSEIAHAKEYKVVVNRNSIGNISRITIVSDMGVADINLNDYVDDGFLKANETYEVVVYCDSGKSTIDIVEALEHIGNNNLSIKSGNGISDILGFKLAGHGISWIDDDGHYHDGSVKGTLQ